MEKLKVTITLLKDTRVGTYLSQLSPSDRTLVMLEAMAFYLSSGFNNTGPGKLSGILQGSENPSTAPETPVSTQRKSAPLPEEKRKTSGKTPRKSQKRSAISRPAEKYPVVSVQIERPSAKEPDSVRRTPEKLSTEGARTAPIDQASSKETGTSCIKEGPPELPRPNSTAKPTPSDLLASLGNTSGTSRSRGLANQVWD